MQRSTVDRRCSRRRIRGDPEFRGYLCRLGAGRARRPRARSLRSHGDRRPRAARVSVQGQRLIVREPWARQAASTSCGRQLQELGDSLSHGEPGEPVLVGECHFTNWSADQYIAALKAILEYEKLNLTGILGQSYGALPAAEAARAFPAAWLLLHAPISPPGRPATDVLKGRAQALRNASIGVTGSSAPAMPRTAPALDLTRPPVLSRRRWGSAKSPTAAYPYVTVTLRWPSWQPPTTFRRIRAGSGRLCSPTWLKRILRWQRDSRTNSYNASETVRFPIVSARTSAESAERTPGG